MDISKNTETESFKFIKRVLTPQTEKDIYYINHENLERSYYFIILLGCLMVLYMILS